MATLNDIAARVGVSKSTVSKALHNASDISAEMRQKILDTAVEMGYTNKRMMHHNRTLCILIENMDYNTPNQFGYDLILGFKQLASPDGWNIEVVPVTKEFQTQTSYDEFMLDNNYHGALVLGFSLIDPWMEDFRTTKMPTVLYDNYFKGNPHIASIGCDNQEGFELAVKHLISLGHQKIGLISGPLESYIMKARYNAYINALKKYHLDIDEAFIGFDYYITDSVKNHLQRMYDLGVTAILFSHDMRAIPALADCPNHGIRVPEDLSIIGFDDLPMTAYTNPPLTTIRQDRISLGKTGYYAMSCLLNNVPIGSILLRAPLILRGSTGPAKSRPDAETV